jgi:ABC-type transport system involved in multi-copper enzyme maturation permease subunit
MFPVRYLFHRLNQNPLVNIERQVLEKQVRSLLHWRYAPLHFLLLAGLLAAVFPLWFYMTVDYSRLLAAMCIVIIAAHLVIHTRTLSIATRTMARDVLLESGQPLSQDLDALQVVMGKWWAVVRHVWRWHLLLGLMRAGLALALAQHIYDSARHSTCGSPFNSLCYSGISLYDMAQLQPAVYKGVLALVILGGFSLLEPCWLAALGVLGAILARRRQVSPIFVTLILYGLVIGVVFGAAAYVDQVIERYGLYYSSHYHPYYYWYSNETWIYKSAIVGVFPIFDGGLLLATQMMRPYSPSTFNVVLQQTIALVSIASYGIVITSVLLIAQWLVPGCKGHSSEWRSFLHRRRARFKSWLHNPITQDQRRVSRRNRWLHSRWIHLIELIIFAGAFVMAWRPFSHPIYCDRGYDLRVITSVVFAVRAAVTLRTLLLATHAMSRSSEEQTWELLASTPIDARQLVLGKWWAVLRSVWVYHAAVAILTLGLLYGLAQYMRDTPIGFTNDVTELERFFYYISTNYQGSGCYQNSPGVFGHVNIVIPPSQMLQWAGLLLSFAILEAGFLSALGLVSGLIARRYAALQLALAIFLRAAPIVLGILFMQISTRQINLVNSRNQLSPNPLERDERLSWVRTVDTFQVAAATQFDGGLGSVNLMHKYGYSRRRQLVAQEMGLVLYGLLIFSVLRWAEKLAVRRGMLSPP